MSSMETNPVLRSAAWRISLWASLAFAVGTMMMFAMLHRFVADDIQRRSDAWLSGEVEVLGDVAERTPKNSLYQRVVGEVAELASREVPNHQRSADAENDAVFFLQAGDYGPARLWVGSGDAAVSLAAIRATQVIPDVPFDVHLTGFSVPFRVASVRIKDGSNIYLGLSEKDELRVLRNMRLRFLMLWVASVVLGFSIVFYATRKMLGRVRKITEAASRIGQSDLSSRVSDTKGKDEIGHLARTLNHMLDRIESTVHQLHTMTDALAHDLRSPLTAIRGRLETTLSGDLRPANADSIVSAIEELDRLSEFLNTSLDVAEAKADALRLSRTELDLANLVSDMIDLYEPSMSDKGLQIRFRYIEPVRVMADAALFHRVIANLLDNEMKHLPECCAIWLTLRTGDGQATLSLEDDGPGFDADIGDQLFQRRVKGRASRGHGLGLAFIEAVVRVHGGTVAAANRPQGGAQIIITIPLCTNRIEKEAGLLALLSD